MEPRVIRDELQYSAYLDEVKRLATMDPPHGSPEADRLQLLALLVEKYEKERFLTGKPDPVDAIELRLAEFGMQQKDLANILGSKSRASEVLSRKRPLSLEMVRAVRDRLQIPADVLVQPIRKHGETAQEFDWSKFPAKEMLSRGWLNASPKDRLNLSAAVQQFFAHFSASAAPVLLRRTITGSLRDTDRYALYAWIARVLLRARELRKPKVSYEKGSISDEFIQQVAKLSWSEKGPQLAQEFLAMKGITLIIEPHLPGTRLDGAAMLDEDGTPVIGLTVRHDRLDNFWFTLLHELAHIQKHIDAVETTFVDDTEEGDASERAESEADQIAANAFVPRAIWRRSSAYRLKTAEAVNALANELRVSPAVIAGRIRREANNYRILTKLVGHGAVRKQFRDVKWPKG